MSSIMLLKLIGLLISGVPTHVSTGDVRGSSIPGAHVRSSVPRVGVSNKGTAKLSPASALDSVGFAITNLNTSGTETYTLSSGVTGALTASGTIPGTVTLDAGDETTVWRKYVTSGAGSSGVAWLSASAGVAHDSGYVNVSVPTAPGARSFLALSPRSGKVFHYHESGIRKTVATVDAFNNGDTTITVSLQPSSSNAVVGSLLVQQLPSGSPASSLTVALTANSKQSFKVTALTTGGGSATVKLVGTNGSWADTAQFLDSVTTVPPTVTVPGDTVLLQPYYEVGFGRAKNWFYAINGPTPADWTFTALEPNPYPMLSAFSAPQTIHFEPNESKLITSSATLPDTAGITWLCTNITGYGLPTKQICGEVRPRPSNRVLSMTMSSNAPSTIGAETEAWLADTITLQVQDAHALVDNPYSNIHFLRVRSRDNAVFRVTQLQVLATTFCPTETVVADSMVLSFKASTQVYRSCLTRRFLIKGITGKLGGRTQVEIIASNWADRDNRKTIERSVEASLPITVAVHDVSPSLQYVPVGVQDSVEFVVSARQQFTANIRAFISAQFRIDEVVSLDDNQLMWPNASQLPGDSAYFSHAFGRNQSRRYRLRFTPVALGTTPITIVASMKQVVSRDSAFVTSSAATSVTADVAMMPTDQLPRSSCPTFGAGVGLAWQCGDVMSAHSTVPYTSRGEQHALTLLYNSQSAAARSAIVANVTVPAGQTATSLRAIVRVGTDTNSFGTPETMYFAGSGFFNGATRRISPRIELTGKPTGLYVWELKISPMNNDTAGATTIFRGRLVHVNNTLNNPVGAGWQIAGVDRIFAAGSAAPDSSVVIVEGDGTARLFVKTPGAWQSPKGDFTRLRVENGFIVRHYKNGVEKWYDLAKTAMTKATDPVGVSSSYYWSNPTGVWRLDSLVDEAGVRSVLYYGSGQLDSIRAPAIAPIKALRISHTGSTIDTITDPNNQKTSFAYNARKLMTSRTGPKGGQLVQLTYDSAYTVTTSSGADLLNFRSIRSGGFADGITVGTFASPAATLPWDAPVFVKTSTTDSTTMNVDALGMPSLISPPAGTTTRIIRNATTGLPDTIWTKGLRIREKYDPASGDLLLSQTAWAVPQADTLAPWRWDSTQTSYAYDSVFHHVTRITQADGNVSEIFYTGPFRDSVMVAGTTMARFNYLETDLQTNLNAARETPGVIESPDSSTVRRGQLKLIWERGKSHPFELEYGAYGNVSAVMTAEQHARDRGERTRYLYDATGVRPYAVVDAANDTTTFFFDEIGRVVKRTMVGRAASPPPLKLTRQWKDRLVRTDSTYYDDPNNTVKIFTPSPTGGSYVSRTIFDGAGRVVQDCPYTAAGSAPAPECDINTYQNGLLVTRQLRSGARHDFVNDGLGRVLTQTITAPGATSLQSPDARAYAADTLTFVHTDQGIFSAGNRAAFVQREYEGPYLKWEIQSVNDFQPDPQTQWANNRHELMFRYSYDVMGRVIRREMGKPQPYVKQVCAPDQRCVFQREFEKDSTNGDTLKVVTTYAYDAWGRVDSLHWNGWKRRRTGAATPARGFRFGYDMAGRWNSLTNTAAAGTAASPYVFSAAYNQDEEVDATLWSRGAGYVAFYDTLDAVMGGGPNSVRDALGRPTFKSNRDLLKIPLYYDGLGQLVRAGNEEFAYDSGGAGQLQYGTAEGTLKYNSKGQLDERSPSDTTRYQYDLSGNRVREDVSTNGFGPADVQLAYDGRGKLISRRQQSVTGGDTTYQVSAYWYDALGRRVLESDSLRFGRGKVKRFYYEGAGPSAGSSPSRKAMFKRRRTRFGRR